MIQKRIQLTLFIPSFQSETIEKIRAEFNPEQFRLINAHVTLCREDELTDIDQVIHNIKNNPLESVTLNLNKIKRFSEEKGVLIPAFSRDGSFKQLRKNILSGIIPDIRNHEAHITLMHPRNSTCTNEIFSQIEQFSIPETITFNEICLIEQEVDQKWKILERFQLK
jgi:2'-5' RNA ligase